MKDFFDQNEVLRVLQGFNPWWQGRSLRVPPFKRLAYFAARRHLDDPSLHRAILLSGPRRVGKTTILSQVAADLVGEGTEPASVLYLSLDHPLLKLVRLERILRTYHENVYPEGKPATLLLDEIQYSAEWQLELKQLVDHRPNYHLLATGSASLVHQRGIADTGVGRWVRLTVPTLSFYEFLQIRGETPEGVPETLRPVDLLDKTDAELSGLAAQFRGVEPPFLRYLLVGGFPETAQQPDLALCQRLLREDVVERVLKRDMAALFGVRNVNDLERLFIYLCLHSGGIIAVKTCADALGTLPATVSNHLELLREANLIYRVGPYETSGKKVLKARYKIYLVDAALRNAVLLRGEQVLADPQEMGVMVETAVFRHLYSYYYRDTPETLYWRDPTSDKEVDIIVRSPSYTIPVEVKYRESAPLSEDSGLVAFCRSQQPYHAFWVTRREDDFGTRQFAGTKTRFLQIPAHIFLYLVGQAERLQWEKSTIGR